MRTSIIALAGLCALAIASPDRVAKRQANPSLSSVLSKISSLSAQLVPPTKIAAELTGVPTSVYSVLADPTALASLEAQFMTAPPAWFTALPADAQAYIYSVAPKYLSIIPEIKSLVAAAGLTAAGGSTGTGTAVYSSSTAKMTSMSVSNTTMTSSKMATTSSSSSKVGTTTAPTSVTATTKASTSSSSGAAAHTNVLAAGVMGAVGFLGMALAL